MRPNINAIFQFFKKFVIDPELPESARKGLFNLKTWQSNTTIVRRGLHGQDILTLRGGKSKIGLVDSKISDIFGIDFSGIDLLVVKNPSIKKIGGMQFWLKKSLPYVTGTSTISSMGPSKTIVGIGVSGVLRKTFSLLPFIPPVVGAGVGLTAAAGFTFLFKKTLKAIEYVDGAKEHMRSLEFGGSLGPGFRSEHAATERSRLTSALMESPNSGRRFFGQEAKIYGGLR